MCAEERDVCVTIDMEVFFFSFLLLKHAKRKFSSAASVSVFEVDKYW